MVTVRWWPVILLELMWNDLWHMKVIITSTFCCDYPWKSIVYGSGKLWELFPPTLWSPRERFNCTGSHNLTCNNRRKIHLENPTTNKLALVKKSAHTNLRLSLHKTNSSAEQIYIKTTDCSAARTAGISMPITACNSLIIVPRPQHRLLPRWHPLLTVHRPTSFVICWISYAAPIIWYTVVCLQTFCCANVNLALRYT